MARTPRKSGKPRLARQAPHSRPGPVAATPQPQTPGGERAQFDDVAVDTPRQPALPFSVVCIGASAGGLEAFSQLLGALPVDTGMAFVLVSHLSPSHPSHLAEIMQRASHPDHLLVAVSGYSGEETRRRAKEAGFDEYVIKPFDPQAVDDLLSRRAR